MGVANQFSWLATSTAMGMSHGFGTMLAHRFGARDTDGLHTAFTTALMLSIGADAVFAVTAVAATRPMLLFLRTPPEILPDAAKRLYALLELAGAGMEGAVATFVGQNHGAGRSLGMRQARNVLLISAAGVMLCLFPGRRWVLGLFTDASDPLASSILSAATG